MTNHKAIQSIFTGLRPFTVGFDDMFDHFDMLTTQLPSMTATNYPPYNIVKTGSLSYDIEVALAGYNKKEDEKQEGENLYKGIAKRMFKKSFTIADDVEVKGAELKDGLLKVSLEKIIPDHKKARTINIK